MRKLLIITLLIAAVLCGCGSQTNSTSSQSTVSVILPDTETATTVNGYLNSNAMNSESKFNIEYFANKNTKKFHLSSCRWAKSIKDENLYKSYNRELLISDGYEPCKTCKP